MGEVMREAGYSNTVSLKPKKLTSSKGWNELMEEYLPDSMLGERHKEFLMSEKIVRKWVKGEIEYETEETDPSAVKALDMAYKLKSRYSDVNIGQALIVNMSEAIAKKHGFNPSPEHDSLGSSSV